MFDLALTEAGYTVIAATSAEDAIEAYLGVPSRCDGADFLGESMTEPIDRDDALDALNTDLAALAALHLPELMRRLSEFTIELTALRNLTLGRLGVSKDEWSAAISAARAEQAAGIAVNMALDKAPLWQIARQIEEDFARAFAKHKRSTK